jgi:hypothetical protein
MKKEGGGAVASRVAENRAAAVFVAMLLLSFLLASATPQAVAQRYGDEAVTYLRESDGQNIKSKAVKKSSKPREKRGFELFDTFFRPSS